MAFLYSICKKEKKSHYNFLSLNISNKRTNSLYSTWAVADQTAKLDDIITEENKEMNKPTTTTTATTSLQMETNNLPVIAKKFWRMVRVMFFMLRKGISKGKLMIDLNMMMKRGKIAGKALQNLMFHHMTHNWIVNSAAASASSSHRRQQQQHHLHFEAPPNEYEFSCSNSPAIFHLMNAGGGGGGNKKKSTNLFKSCVAHVRAPTQEFEYDDFTVQAVIKALEMMQSNEAPSPSPSPALPGFGNGKSPMVRQLRITDSPFPLKDVEEDSHVDEAAENFIKKFYKDLRRQNALMSP